MRFNTRVRYGLRTMIELACCQETGEPQYQKDIAQKQEISNKYLDQIITALKTAGLIVNAGGKKSGYILTKKPEKINVYDIFKAFEPELSIVDCLSDNMECSRNKICAAQEFWQGLNQTMVEYMQFYTLKELAEKQQDKLNSV